MNTIVTSKESILNVSRELIKTKGWTALNIRTVASVSGVSVGTIYNYFRSKSDLVAATVESIWYEIFHFPEGPHAFDSFTDCIKWIFDSMEKGNETYPGFFSLHSMSFLGEEKSSGKQLMGKSWEHIKNQMRLVLINDKDIRRGAFDGVFTQEKFVDMIFSLILSALMQQDYSCSGIVEMIRRLLY